MPITVSRTVVAVGASAHEEIVYWWEMAGVKVYQTLCEGRSLSVGQSGSTGSPFVVAPVMSRMLVQTGNPWLAGMSSALAQRSLAGGSAPADIAMHASINGNS